MASRVSGRSADDDAAACRYRSGDPVWARRRRPADGGSVRAVCRERRPLWAPTRRGRSSGAVAARRRRTGTVAGGRQRRLRRSGRAVSCGLGDLAGRRFAGVSRDDVVSLGAGRRLRIGSLRRRGPHPDTKRPLGRTPRPRRTADVGAAARPARGLSAGRQRDRRAVRSRGDGRARPAVSTGDTARTRCRLRYLYAGQSAVDGSACVAW
jgi:hypothetical protein